MINRFKGSKVVVGFTASSLFKTFAAMAMSLIAIKVIGPEKLGLWQAALIIKPYIGFLQLGLTEGLGRQLPFYMGQDKMSRVKEYAATAQFVTIRYTVIFFLIAVFLAIFIAEGLEEILVFLTAGIFISTMFVDNYLSSTYRSSKSFQDLSRVYAISSILGVVLIPLIFFFDFLGYLGLLLIHSIFSTVLLVVYRPFKVKSNFIKPIYIENIKIGFPMLCFNFLKHIPSTYPRVIIVFLLSTTALGLTAPANAAMMAFGILPGALAKYMFPNLNFDYGKTGDKKRLWKKIRKISIYLTGFGVLGLLSLLIIPYAIENFFPKYEEAITISMIAVIIGFFRMYALIYQVLNTLKDYASQLKISIITNVLYILAPLAMYFMAPEDQKLNYIFIGALLAEIISTLSMFYIIYMTLHRPDRNLKGINLN